MQNIKDQLSSVHPLFRIPSTRIFWADNVMKRNTHNSLQSRYLVIASPGIFLFERKTFPKGYAISRIIPYSDLVLITAQSDESFDFFKAKVTMRLQHPKNAEVVAMVIAIRDVLFGGKVRYPKLVLDKEIQKKIEESNFIFESDSLLADRFLSLSLETPVKHINYDQLLEYHEKCINSPAGFSINAEMLASNLISPLSKAIAYDSDIQSLQLDSVNFSSFVQYFKTIIMNNSSIQNLLLTSVSFKDSLVDFIQIFNQKTMCQINFISFLHCQLISTNFLAFLSAFHKYQTGIQTLLFISCNIDKTILEKILATICSANCFQALSELYFSEVKDKNPLEPVLAKFFESPFIANHKNLQYISLMNCQLNLDQLLPHFLNHIKSIRFANFSYNSCLFEAQISNFSSLDEIDLSYVNFTPSSLFALFKCFYTISSSVKHIPSQISFNGVQMSDSDWNEFYNKLSNPEFTDSIGKIANLKMLSWCYNKMNGKQVEAFIHFLSNKLPDITELGLSFTIQNFDIDSSLQILSKYFETHTIRKLDFRGGNNSVFGPKMEPLLKSLVTNGSLKMLDITGQRAGSKCYDYLIKLVETSLEELRFDNNSPSDIEILKKILNSILNSKLNFADWPQKDIKESISKIKLTSRSSAISNFKELHNVYKKKFVTPNKLTHNLSADLVGSSTNLSLNENPPDVSESSGNLPFLRQRSTSILKSKLKSDGSIKRVSNNTTTIDLQFLKSRPPVVDEAIYECFGEEELKDEPILDSFLNGQ